MLTELATAAITAGIANGATQLPGVSELDGALEKIPEIGQVLATGANDAIASTLSQGVEVAVGLQSKFD